jgi:hypothetical protein
MNVTNLKNILRPRYKLKNTSNTTPTMKPYDEANNFNRPVITR